MNRTQKQTNASIDHIDANWDTDINNDDDCDEDYSHGNTDDDADFQEKEEKKCTPSLPTPNWKPKRQ